MPDHLLFPGDPDEVVDFYRKIAGAADRPAIARGPRAKVCHVLCDKFFISPLKTGEFAYWKLVT